MSKIFLSVLFLVVLGLVSCGALENEDISESASENSSSGDLPVLFTQFSDNVTAYAQGDEIILETDDIPDHPSPYFEEGEELYEEPDGGMVVNPNGIDEQDYVFRIPANPQESDDETETDLGAIGVAVNGVVLFNQYAGRTLSGDWLPLDDEIDTFDRFNGHPAQQDNYHYHLEPLYLTAQDDSALVGIILDGFPIYGPREGDGSFPGGLDDCNGHFGETPDHPEGTYHYHVTDREPYLVGCYRGEPGTVSQ